MKSPIWVLFASVLLFICCQIQVRFVFACIRPNQNLIPNYICYWQALRCRSDDGLNAEEMKRIARTCMRNVGHRDSNSSDSDNSNSDDDDNDDDSNSDDNNGDDYPGGGRNRNQYNNNRGGNGGGNGGGGGGRPRQRYDYRRFRDVAINAHEQTDRQQNWGSDNTNNRQGQQSHQQNRHNNRYDQQYATNNTEQDRNCLMHCFFREMKMVWNCACGQKRETAMALIVLFLHVSLADKQRRLSGQTQNGKCAGQGCARTRAARFFHRFHSAVLSYGRNDERPPQTEGQMRVHTGHCDMFDGAGQGQLR